MQVLFIHRSVGRNLLKYGHIHQLLKPYAPDISFSDYDHNSGILSTASTHQKLNYVFPGRNTYPHNLASLLSEPTDATRPILDWISTYDAVLLKSCYPTTKIKSDAGLEQLKQNYLSIAAYFNKSGQKLGLLTPPPMRPGLTKPEWAYRARRLAAWLLSTDFGETVTVFDLFDLLAVAEGSEDANTLRKDYRRFLFYDAHPNRKANAAIAPRFVEFIRTLAKS